MKESVPELLCMLGRDALPGPFRLEAGQALRLTLLALPGVSVDASLEVQLLGPGAELDLGGLYLCRSDERVRLSVRVRHEAGGAVSHQLLKGIVDGTARFSFDGLIYVAPDAQKTEAVQQNHSLLLSDSCQAETRPQLEIYADDVICSHGATLGHLNADEQFYMRSRGIPEEEARRLQMISFLSPVLSRLPEALQEECLAAL
ncbi:MAG: SufD family Fe-S cluster assembly protein [Bacteroidales bacterium]|nr:SufD family Fe-S cluster assembly protein [Bacteroidales bacterium]